MQRTINRIIVLIKVWLFNSLYISLRGGGGLLDLVIHPFPGIQLEGHYK